VGPMDDAAEDEIYQWCWEAMADTGVGSQVCGPRLSLCAWCVPLSCRSMRLDRGCVVQVVGMGGADNKDSELRYHSVDILLKLVEHALEKDENRDEIEKIMRDALMNGTSHGMALMGATGMNAMLVRKGIYR
jgi:hypothetical protein